MSSGVRQFLLAAGWQFVVYLLFIVPMQARGEEGEGICIRNGVPRRCFLVQDRFYLAHSTSVDTAIIWLDNGERTNCSERWKSCIDWGQSIPTDVRVYYKNASIYYVGSGVVIVVPEFRD